MGGLAEASPDCKTSNSKRLNIKMSVSWLERVLKKADGAMITGR